MHSAEGVEQGRGQGGREFSRTLSSTVLPGPTSDDESQGGAGSRVVDARNRLQSTHVGTRRAAPSLPTRNEESIIVRVPAEPPALTAGVARVLLSILVELTRIEILDEPPRRVDD
jgi:hypothetical protein